MTNTPHHTTPVFYHRKNNGCTSWVFFLVLLDIFFVEKHQQRQPMTISHKIQGTTSIKKHDEQPIETTGVGDD
ncbi:MAG: hypothetical protein MUC80_04800 [Candidatus Thermoplasmatota archaeon]|nr:hypothetical protein [Candidatus Thermoplasmatota archaeon]